MYFFLFFRFAKTYRLENQIGVKEDQSLGKNEQTFEKAEDDKERLTGRRKKEKKSRIKETKKKKPMEKSNHS